MVNSAGTYGCASTYQLYLGRLPNFANLEISRFSTLQAGDVIVPLGTQTPGIFEPTMTAVARLNAHDPSLPENQMIDEHGVEMVLVPAGCFFMGSDRGDRDEQPIHETCVEDPFWIDKTEVTQEQFERLGGEKERENAFDGPQRPVERITWFEARDYCQNQRDARLPTEAEWEYAARGPDALAYPWGNDYDAGLVIGRDDADYGNTRTAPVGSRPGGVSWVGALDMSGNVWEWTSSLYEDYPYAADDGRERDTGDSTDVPRVLRGGSFGGTSGDLRSANRGWFLPDFVNIFNGFRCARSY